MLMFDRLNALAKEKGVSKSHLCRLIGRNEYYLRDCEKKQIEIEPKNIVIIAKALGTTSDYLLGETDDPSLQENDSLKTAQAALFGGLYDRLSEQEMDNLWADAQEFAQFKATQMIRGKGKK